MSRFLNKIRRIKQKLSPAIGYIKYKGFCPICNDKTNFYASALYFRDSLICTKCESLPRERALMKTLNEFAPDWRYLKIHESSPINRGVSPKLKAECPNYTQTQYYPNNQLGSSVKNFRNEDLENQTFEDNTFDIVITQDVMEHLFNPDKAFSEISRTLKKGGKHIFTFPLINHYNKTEVWASKNTNTGDIIYHGQPEYHGNPVDQKGSLVTMHWGSDIVSYINNATDGDLTYILHNEDIHNGIIGELSETFVTIKK